MEVTVIDATEHPVEVISRSMGTCYGHDDVKETRVMRAYSAGHMSVFEHAKFTVKIEGVSRVLTHQLVRHRMASYCQESQRYVKYDDLSGDDWYTIPDSIRLGKNLQRYVSIMHACADVYAELLDAGIAAEDARYVLPGAMRSTIVMTMNVREWFAFYELRTDPHAQEEIRRLAETIDNELLKLSPEWASLMLTKYQPMV